MIDSGDVDDQSVMSLRPDSFILEFQEGYIDVIIC